MYIAHNQPAGTKAEVLISLIGTKGESKKISIGSISKTTR
jgi:hypothetical protein